MYDALANVTRHMRNKETAWDYRFLAEPDLPPLVLDEVFSHSLKFYTIDILQGIH